VVTPEGSWTGSSTLPHLHHISFPTIALDSAQVAKGEVSLSILTNMPGGPFADRVVLVTGAGRGLGQSHARLLASLGATLMLNDAGVDSDGSGSDDAPVKELEREVRAGGAAVAASSLDLATGEACRRLVDDTVARFGRIDALSIAPGSWIERPSESSMSIG
jgi:hypothetical protein